MLLHIDRQICNWVSRKKAMTSIIRDGGRSENLGGRILSGHFVEQVLMLNLHKYWCLNLYLFPSGSTGPGKLYTCHKFGHPVFVIKQKRSLHCDTMVIRGEFKEFWDFEGTFFVYKNMLQKLIFSPLSTLQWN